MAKKTIAVFGNSVAEAIALVLRSLPSVSADYDVVYLSSFEDEPSSLRRCDVFWEQQLGKRPAILKLPKNAIRVSFPRLEFNLLWPFNCVNPFNRPEPPKYPFGRFPYGDSFIVNCLRRGVSQDDILKYYAAPHWASTWPSIDELFEREQKRLLSSDESHDVKIGTFILDNFQRERLFWAVNSPTNKLFGEFVFRLLKTTFGAERAVEREEIERLLSAFGARELLGAIGVPVHPLVAEHFKLEWYDPQERYRNFDNPTLSYSEYFSEMIGAASSEKIRSRRTPVRGRRLPTMIVYGNCQAEALAVVLAKDPLASANLRVAYSRSFDHPAEGRGELQPDDIEKCVLLCEQHDRQPFPDKKTLPKKCKMVTFPALDLNSLWPFNCVNPYNVPEPPGFPFGRFPYGNRTIIEAIDKGLPPEEILAYYLDGWERYKPDLSRLHRLERARITARDSNCEIKMGSYVLENFPKQRLFWSINHPSGKLLEVLIERILREAVDVVRGLSSINVSSTLQSYFSPPEPLGAVSIPIHPKVAEHFRLDWYDRGETFRSWDGGTYSYEQYFEALIRHSYAFKMQRPQAAKRAAAR